MVPTLEGEFARKRRMMVGLWDIVVGEGMLAPARLPAALRLRARLAPAAALPDPVPAPASRFAANLALLGEGWVYVVDPRRPARPARRGPARPRFVPLGAAAHRPLLRDDHRLDRRRPLGPRPPRRPGHLGEGRGDPVPDAARPRHPRSPPSRCCSSRRSCWSPRSRSSSAAAGRSSTASAASASAGREFEMLKLRTMVAGLRPGRRSAPSSPATTPASPRAGRFLRRTSLDEIPNLVNVLRGEMAIVGPRPTIPAQVDDYTPRQHRRHEVCPGSPAGPRSRAAPASPGRSGSSSTSSTSTTAAPPSTLRILARDRLAAPHRPRPRPRLGFAAWQSNRRSACAPSSPATRRPCTAGSTTPRRPRR